MEAGKQSSSSSFTSSLFGAKVSSSSQILTSIFAPPLPKVRGGESSQNDNNKVSLTRASSTKTPVQGEEEKKWSRKEKSWCYDEEKVEPFHYSSSIFYGAQDVYSQPNPPTTSFKKDAGEDDNDDSGSASRGNWWQGSLYY